MSDDENLYMTCQDCGEQKEDVHETTCPYAEEINNHIVDIVVCDECYKQRLWDI